jgi:hypothetical protein
MNEVALMNEEKTYTLPQAQLYFAADFHGKTWELLDKQKRTEDENERMLGCAYASLAHWRAAGTVVRHQRGEWMLARVYAVLGEAQPALHHAHLCIDLLNAHKSEMEDFDFAFAYEAVARAFAIAGDRPQAEKFIEKAQTAGKAIVEKEDRDIFFTEFNGGNWNGLK